MIDKTKPTDFQCIPVNLKILSQKIIENEILCKLLFYCNKEPFKEKNLTNEQKISLIDKEYIQITPQIKVDEENSQKNYIHIAFDNFAPNETNPEYIDSVLIISIACHDDNYKIINKYGDITLRPYEIAHLLHSEIDRKKFTGIGKANFLMGQDFVLASNPEYSGITLKYLLIDSNG